MKVTGSREGDGVVVQTKRASYMVTNALPVHSLYKREREEWLGYYIARQKLAAYQGNQ